MKIVRSFVVFFTLFPFITLMWGCKAKENVALYEYAVINTGTIESTVSAAGTLDVNARVTVQSPATGIIEVLYADFNTPVRKGQIIAEINTAVNPLQKQIIVVYSPIDGIVIDRAVNTDSPVLARGSPAATHCSPLRRVSRK